MGRDICVMASLRRSGIVRVHRFPHRRHWGLLEKKTRRENPQRVRELLIRKERRPHQRHQEGRRGANSLHRGEDGQRQEGNNMPLLSAPKSLMGKSSRKSYKCLKSPKIGQKSKIHTGVRDRTRIKNSRRGRSGASARIKNSHAGMGVYACAWVKIHTGVYARMYVPGREATRVCAAALVRVLRDARDAMRVFIPIRA